MTAHRRTAGSVPAHVERRARVMRRLMRAAVADPAVEPAAWEHLPRALTFFQQYGGGRVRTIEFDRGLCIEGALSDSRSCAVYLHGMRFHERGIQALLDRELAGDAVVMDVGAGEGWFSLVAAARTPQGRVVAFEPGTPRREPLVGNVALNGFDDRVSVEALALSNQPGHADLATTTTFRVAGLGAGEGVVRERSFRERVKTDTLDHWCKRHALGRLDWLRINAGSSAFDVLAGGRRTLQRLQPVILFRGERERLEKAHWDQVRIESTFAELGYAGGALRSDGRSVPLAQAPHDGTWIFRPVRQQEGV